jgi:hypothetical protein
MKKFYYRSNTENHEGDEGFYYCEVLNEVIIRSIQEFNGELYWSTLRSHNNELYMFTDQPEFPDAHIPYLKENYNLIQLTPQEFEALWEKAQAQKY